MTRNHLYIAASLLSLVALALIVLGLPDRSPLWQIGLGLVALAMLLIPAGCSSGRAPTPTPTRAADPVPTAAEVAGPPPAPTPAGSLPAARQGLDLTILHTNDVRGEIDPCG